MSHPAHQAPKIYASGLLVRETPPLDAPLRLLCFPYAGGSSAIYRGWQAALGQSVEVIAVELPGRGTRFGDTPIGDLEALVDSFMLEIPVLLDRPVLFFGHSNGALMAYALALRLRKLQLPLPAHLFLSAKPPPHLERQRRLHRLPSEQLLVELKALGGTPPEVLDNAELMELVLPVLRADFALSETFVHPLVPPLACGATLIGATSDREVAPGEMEEWSRYLRCESAPHLIEGDHFFIDKQRAAVLDIVRATLGKMHP